MAAGSPAEASGEGPAGCWGSPASERGLSHPHLQASTKTTGLDEEEGIALLSAVTSPPSTDPSANTHYF